ncbi:AAA family ATPase [Leptospira andrefontaineae]|uniref:ATP-binding protein n=1 Tax=Leptospira andrefontaineae TaxID=2484976 RepID=A0A4V3JG98_9LEPT|nr:AAA family ATPase [Leptospira andrefontaineae]TGK41432.1 ATP-binding protein [Leptospira andrefontaineae]
MIENLFITSEELLQNYSINGIGRLNIITGKNNSGKSTLLNILRSHEKAAILASCDIRFLEKISAIIRKKFQETEVVPVKNFDFELKKFFSQTSFISNEKLQTQLFSLITQLGERNPDEIFIFDPSIEPLSQIIQREIFTMPKSILIPAKRNSPTESPLNLYEIDRTGNAQNILNILFKLKNSANDPEDSAYYQSIRKNFQEITEGFEFEVSISERNVIKLFFKRDGNYKAAENFGLGLQDILCILTFTLEPSTQLVLIEEPENHLNSGVQKNLLKYFRQSTNKQFIITTHSGVFLNPLFVDKILLTKYDAKKIEIIDSTSKAEALYELGYELSDNIHTDMLILVEGPNDRPIIESLLFNIPDAIGKNIKCLPIGGDNMLHFDFSALQGSAVKICAIIDLDPGSKKIRDKFIKECEDRNIYVHRLERYSIENYIPLQIYREIFKSQISSEITEIDPLKSVESQFGFSVKKNLSKISKLLAIQDIQNTDLHNFLKKVLEIYQAEISLPH